MKHSGNNNPCPSCGRKKDSDCRWTDDVIFCHCGSTHSPDQSLRIGDTIALNGARWALVKTNGGFNGAAFVFKPHKDKFVRSRRVPDSPESYPPSKPSAVSPASALSASSMPIEKRGTSRTSTLSTRISSMKLSRSSRMPHALVAI